MGDEKAERERERERERETSRRIRREKANDKNVGRGKLRYMEVKRLEKLR